MRFLFTKRQLLLALLFILKSNGAVAAACCGGSSSISSLITADEKRTLSFSYSYAEMKADVFPNGVWQKRKDTETSELYRLDAATIFHDLYQVGVSVPVQKRARENANSPASTGLGDVQTQLGYEFLPDWDYNPYRPHGVGFFTLTLPTGTSIYEAQDLSFLESRSRGFWAVGTGIALNKNRGAWDGLTLFEIHYAFEKKIENANFKGTAQPGWGGSFNLGGGYSYKDFRLGGQLVWNYEAPVGFRGSVNSDGALQRFATGSLLFSYLYDREWSGMLSVADQRLFGEPSNTSLSQSVSLSLTKKWLR